VNLPGDPGLSMKDDLWIGSINESGNGDTSVQWTLVEPGPGTRPSPRIKVELLPDFSLCSLSLTIDYITLLTLDVTLSTLDVTSLTLDVTLLPLDVTLLTLDVTLLTLDITLLTLDVTLIESKADLWSVSLESMSKQYLVLHSGLRQEGYRDNETWVLELNPNGGASWRELANAHGPHQDESPVPRFHHCSAVLDCGVILFGG